MCIGHTGPDCRTGVCLGPLFTARGTCCFHSVRSVVSLIRREIATRHFKGMQRRSGKKKKKKKQCSLTAGSSWGSWGEGDPRKDRGALIADPLTRACPLEPGYDMTIPKRLTQQMRPGKGFICVIKEFTMGYFSVFFNVIFFLYF